MKSFHKARSNATTIESTEAFYIRKLEELAETLCECYDIPAEDFKLVFRDRNGSYKQTFHFLNGKQLRSTFELEERINAGKVNDLDDKYLIVLGICDLRHYQTNGYHDYKTVEPYIKIGQKGLVAWKMLLIHEFAHIVQYQREGRTKGEVHTPVFIRAMREIMSLAL